MRDKYRLNKSTFTKTDIINITQSFSWEKLQWWHTPMKVGINYVSRAHLNPPIILPCDDVTGCPAVTSSLSWILGLSAQPPGFTIKSGVCMNLIYTTWGTAAAVAVVAPRLLKACIVKVFTASCVQVQTPDEWRGKLREVEKVGRASLQNGDQRIPLPLVSKLITQGGIFSGYIRSFLITWRTKRKD